MVGRELQRPSFLFININYLEEVYFMADEQKQALTPEQLMAQMQEAFAKGDMAAILKIASEAKKGQKAKEDAELEGKKAQITDLTEQVKVAIQGIVDRFGPSITTLVGEKKAKISAEWSAESPDLKVTILKGGTGGGTRKSGGVPQKVNIKTEDLLEKYGADEYKDGVTFKEAWEASTDKNKRFAIRKKLIAKELPAA
jgi:hypothetical protein